MFSLELTKEQVGYLAMMLHKVVMVDAIDPTMNKKEWELLDDISVKLKEYADGLEK